MAIRKSRKRVILWEQRVDGDHTAEGNRVLEEMSSFRLGVDRARARAKELRNEGHAVQAMTKENATGEIFGYRITEKAPAEGQTGASWNLLVHQFQAPEEAAAEQTAAANAEPIQAAVVPSPEPAQQPSLVSVPDHQNVTE